MLQDRHMPSINFFRDIINLILSKIIGISVLIAIFSLGALLIAVLSPNKYTSVVKLIPAQSTANGRLASLAGQFGGLASLAGVDLSNIGGGDKSGLAIEVMNSRQFVNHFVNKNQLKPFLFAGLRESESNGGWVLDSEIYDVSSARWTRNVSPPFQSEPSDWEAYKKFKEDVLLVSQDKKTGVIQVSITLRSASAAKEWADAFVIDLNNWMREKVIIEKQKSIDFILNEIEQTDVAEMHKLFYSIIEREQSELMLAKTQAEYSLKILDPAVVSPVKSEPKRLIIVLIGVMLGVFSVVLWIMIDYRIKGQEAESA